MSTAEFWIHLRFCHVGDELFVAVPAGSISGSGGLEQLSEEVEAFSSRGATHILIETSGSTHPWPLIDAIRAHDAVQLHGFLSVVDTITLAQDFDLGRSIVPAASQNLAK